MRNSPKQSLNRVKKHKQSLNRERNNTITQFSDHCRYSREHIFFALPLFIQFMAILEDLSGFLSFEGSAGEGGEAPEGGEGGEAAPVDCEAFILQAECVNVCHCNLFPSNVSSLMRKQKDVGGTVRSAIFSQ